MLNVRIVFFVVILASSFLVPAYAETRDELNASVNRVFKEVIADTVKDVEARKEAEIICVDLASGFFCENMPKNVYVDVVNDARALALSVATYAERMPIAEAREKMKAKIVEAKIGISINRSYTDDDIKLRDKLFLAFDSIKDQLGRYVNENWEKIEFGTSELSLSNHWTDYISFGDDWHEKVKGEVKFRLISHSLSFSNENAERYLRRSLSYFSPSDWRSSVKTVNINVIPMAVRDSLYDERGGLRQPKKTLVPFFSDVYRSVLQKVINK